MRWLHNADMLKLESYKAEINKKYAANESLRSKAQVCEKQLEKA